MYIQLTGSLKRKDYFMPGIVMNPLVDTYIEKSVKWREELKLLRAIVLGCGLKEELKWGVPCYTFEKSNIVLIHTFKAYCALLFVKGSLLKDAEGILITQTEHTQARRQRAYLLHFSEPKQSKTRTARVEKYMRQILSGKGLHD
jgi:uncharacterized protein YdeI (YjbR/CyaY-like superfamily)